MGTLFNPGDRFLQELAPLLLPIDAWGTFRMGSRPAAVNAILYRRDGDWHIPFVRRRDDLRDHPGQVALPGGGVRQGETAWEAAAREAEEEVGITAADLVPLGAGTPLYASVSNFHVVPFVAWSREPELLFTHDPGEVEAVLEIPLAKLLTADLWVPAAEPWMGSVFYWDGVPVWGLTERLLADLLPRFSAALDASRTPDPPAVPG